MKFGTENLPPVQHEKNSHLFHYQQSWMWISQNLALLRTSN